MNQIKLKLMVLVALLSLSALAFTPYLPFFGSSAPTPAAALSPTNLPGGYVAFTWYDATLSYTSNGSTATWSNLTSFGSRYDLTNAAGTNCPAKQVAVLNGLDSLLFVGTANGNQRLDCFVWTNQTPFEIFMVVCITNVGARFVLSAIGTSDWAFQVAAQFIVQQGSSATSVIGLTNRYAVLDLVYSNANSSIYTNNVKGLEASSGVNTVARGFRLDSQFNINNSANMGIAALATFTNQLLNAAARSNLYYYFSNRFNTAAP